MSTCDSIFARKKTRCTTKSNRFFNKIIFVFSTILDSMRTKMKHYVHRKNHVITLLFGRFPCIECCPASCSFFCSWNSVSHSFVDICVARIKAKTISFRVVFEAIVVVASMNFRQSAEKRNITLHERIEANQIQWLSQTEEKKSVIESTILLYEYRKEFSFYIKFRETCSFARSFVLYWANEKSAENVGATL